MKKTEQRGYRRESESGGEHINNGDGDEEEGAAVIETETARQMEED